MSRKLKCIMLVDDNPDDNFFHERVIKKSGAAETVISIESAAEAIDFLKDRKYQGENPPNIIFLDLNMPGMNGWEFIDDYKQLDRGLQSQVVVVMLTTSDNAHDIVRARNTGILADFVTKPLTKEKLEDILRKNFPA